MIEIETMKKKISPKKNLFWEDIKGEFKLLRKSNVLCFGIVLNAIFVVLIILLFILSEYSEKVDLAFMSFDFRIFYTSFSLIRSNPSALYTSQQYEFPFRYLPIFSYMNSFISLIPYPIAFIIHTLIMEILHIFSFVLFLVLSKRFYNVEFNSKRRKSYLLIGIVAPLQVPNLAFGQISEIYILLVLCSIILIENEKIERYQIRGAKFLSGFLIGLASLYKPFGILLIPLLLKGSISWKKKKFQISFKSSFIALLGYIMPILPNIFFWVMYPNLLQDFIKINQSAQILIYPSTSITRVLGLLPKFLNFSISQTILMIILAAILFGFIYGIFLIIPLHKRNYSMFFGLSHLILLIVYPDSWFLYFHIWFFVALPGILNIEDALNRKADNLKQKQKQKMLTSSKIIFIICNYGMVYFTLGIVIAMLLTEIDIIFPILLLILLYVILWQLILFLKIPEETN
ncbi:hypothetical protein NEF87_000379 [Candidatus Lokiarchaeum ossiferum]|uniref:DUF2029 domain-containing protein n=1 Tax=Candidatus Lokiarchaeum ossiferum TaxID=2951803 RepID=A0ABY6HKP0_9ARCH|nr:hypothetical protein NEF87_000379 [Candidatus Lokiarchaeum sp. B-35]